MLQPLDDGVVFGFILTVFGCQPPTDGDQAGFGVVCPAAVGKVIDKQLVGLEYFLFLAIGIFLGYRLEKLASVK
ncbi:MAG: hypothetical protein IIA60_06510 [Candidatus Marinimicrobia bacterium]|nr:hypothetical protein [Candidatus Neomarinimicrobiota bacterium]